MSGGRPKNFAHIVTIRIQPEVYAKILLLRPQLADPAQPDKFRYGAVSTYVDLLMRQDLAKIEEKLK